METYDSNIDLEIKDYFLNYLSHVLNISVIHYELVKTKRRCIFKIKINSIIENLIIEYQEDFIGEYYVYFKTTASSDFLIAFITPLLKTELIDYKNRFNFLIDKISQTSQKFRIFDKITMLNSDVISTRSQLDRTYGLHYNIINSPRNISVSINNNLYSHQKRVHYFKTIITFSFKNNRLSAECLIFNQSMASEKNDYIELSLVGNEKVFSKNLRNFQKSLEMFAIDELFNPIHTHYGIPFNEILEMSEAELKTYADVINMLRI